MKTKLMGTMGLPATGILLTLAAAIAWWSGSIGLQIALATLVLIATLLLTLNAANRRRDSTSLGRPIETLLKLAKAPEISAVHDRIAQSLVEVTAKSDSIYRRLALQSLENVTDKCARIAAGTIEYQSTETWRVVYEELLRSPGLHLYRSVAHVESAHYWQDGPGRQSTLLNLELHDAGVINIERIVIVADHLCSPEQLPVEPIQAWLYEQHSHGIWLRIVRESQLAGETDLVSDFGIYGTRAVGTQLADVAGRTARFVLSFDFDHVEQAEQTWKRLEVFSTPYREVLDR